MSGIRVVEVAIGASDLLLGHAGGVPGRLLADLGATVTRVVGPEDPAIDADVEWGRVWHRGKTIVRTDDPAPLLRDADVVLDYGSGPAYDELAAANPGLVHVRCTGDEPWFIVEARAGFCTQLAAHRPGPMLVDVRASATGASFLMTASALALLRRRVLTGRGGWAETSLHDGLLATLG